MELIIFKCWGELRNSFPVTVRLIISIHPKMQSNEPHPLNSLGTIQPKLKVSKFHCFPGGRRGQRTETLTRYVF